MDFSIQARRCGAMAAFIAAFAALKLIEFRASILCYQIAGGFAAVLAAWSLHRFVAAVRRDRQVTDTPLVRIRSAAQGYVKVSGRAATAGDRPTAAPLSSRPCVWWSYTVEQMDGARKNEWRLIDSASSVEPFVLADAGAHCLVGPINAEITPTTNDVWYGNTVRPSGPPRHDASLFQRGKFRYSERLLAVGEHLSVTGELRSDSELTCTDGAAALLRRWKENQASLLTRFDGNHDGRLDAAEWDAARAAATSEAQSRLLRAPVVRVSVISEPTHGEPFLIAPIEAAQLARREKRRSLLFLVVGLVSITVCALAFEHVHALAASNAR